MNMDSTSFEVNTPIQTDYQVALQHLKEWLAYGDQLNARNSDMKQKINSLRTRHEHLTSLQSVYYDIFEAQCDLHRTLVASSSMSLPRPARSQASNLDPTLSMPLNDRSASFDL